MRRKTVLIITCMLLVTIVLSVVYYYFWHVPHTLSEQYVSVSFSPNFYTGPGFAGLHLEYQGKAINATIVWIQINVSNSYFQPVYVNFNGFDVVWLIYNTTVSNPPDVVSNRNSLVWGAYDYLLLAGISHPNGIIDDFAGDGFKFYADRMGLSNFTTTIRSGAYFKNYPLFSSPSTAPGYWAGQYWFDVHSRVPPGTYYMYCIIFGITSGPQNVTITSILY